MNLKQENAVSRAWIEWFHQGFESCVDTKEGLFNTCVYQVRILFLLHTSKATSTTLPRIGELRPQLLTPHWLEQAAQCMKYEGYNMKNSENLLHNHSLQPCRVCVCNRMNLKRENEARAVDVWLQGMLKKNKATADLTC